MLSSIGIRVGIRICVGLVFRYICRLIRKLRKRLLAFRARVALRFWLFGRPCEPLGGGLGSPWLAKHAKYDVLSSCAAAHVRHRACGSGLPRVVCDPRGNSSRWMVRATRSEARALVPGSWLIRRLGRIKVCTKIRDRTLPGAPPQREQRFPRVWSAPEAFTGGILLSAGFDKD